MQLDGFLLVISLPFLMSFCLKGSPSLCSPFNSTKRPLASSTLALGWMGGMEQSPGLLLPESPCLLLSPLPGRAVFSRITSLLSWSPQIWLARPLVVGLTRPLLPCLLHYHDSPSLHSALLLSRIPRSHRWNERFGGPDLPLTWDLGMWDLIQSFWFSDLCNGNVSEKKMMWL